ncbi:hypothetical protein [Methanobrevibacter sp.]|nr:hypothetical protein [Methanobrevibacter sp.]
MFHLKLLAKSSDFFVLSYILLSPYVAPACDNPVSQINLANRKQN